MSSYSVSDFATILALVRSDLTGEGLQPSGRENLDCATAPGLVRCADEHGAGPIAYRAAKHNSNIPPEWAEALRPIAESDAFRSWFLTSELLNILRTFREECIPAICLKGPSLALRGYGQIADRPSVDIDILIRPEDVPRASSLIEQRGYRHENASEKVEVAYHAIFGRAADNSLVELHWYLLPGWQRAPIDLPGIWSRVDYVHIGQQPVPTLSLEDTLLFLAVHGFKHEWSQLKWIADIAYLTRNQQIDWKTLFLRAKRARCLRMVLVSLHLTTFLFGPGLPSEAAEFAAKDKTAQAIAERFGKSLLTGVRLDNMQLRAYSYQIREHWRDRAYLLGQAFLHAFRMTEKDGIYSDQSFAEKMLRFLHRPLRVYREYGLSWIKVFVRPRAENLSSPLQ